MLKKAEKFMSFLEKGEISYPLFLFTFFSLISARLLVENMIAGFPDRSLHYLFFEFSHTFSFFLFAFLLFLLLLKKFSGTAVKETTSVLLFGFLIILFPPIFDYVYSGGVGYWSFYEFDGIHGLIDRFFSFYGSTPEIGVTYGVRFEVAFSVLFFAGYIFLKTRKKIIALKAAFFSYVLFFVLGTFPSYITILTDGVRKGFFSVRESDVAGMFLSPNNIFERPLVDPVSALNVKMSLVYAPLLLFLIGYFLWKEYRHLFLSLFRNARFPQVCYHSGLALLGILLAIFFANAKLEFSFFNMLAILLLIAASVSTWLSSVVANDLADIAIDKKTNPDRPLPTHTINPTLYRSIGFSFFFASIFFASLISFKITLLLIAYQAVASLYSLPPLRLKRFPVIATFTAACASILILLSGFFLISEGDTLALPKTLVFFLLFSYTLLLPLKDFKDIAGDRSDGVFTIPVLLGEFQAKLLFSALSFLTFIGSTFVFHERRLFLPALLFGSLAFFLVQKSSSQKRFFSYRNLAGWMMLLAFFYGAIILLVIS